MDSDRIQKELVKELGDDIIYKIDALKNHDRSSYIRYVSYQFDRQHPIQLYMGDRKPLFDAYNNWQVFNDNKWELICKFDERALTNDQYYHANNRGTSVEIEYTIQFSGSETIQEVIDIIDQYPTYGFFEGMQKIYGSTYKLHWGT